MTFRKRMKKSKLLSVIGLDIVIIGSLVPYILKNTVSESLRDAVAGLLMGVGIGCMLVALRKNCASCSPETPVTQ